MTLPVLYSFKRCPYAMRARMALKLANIQCELREVRLSNKPEHMLKVSPKGTVPILILEDEVIDESIDIINWVLDNSNLFKDNINLKQIGLTENIITTFDNKFKHHLDRYKYSIRYENVDEELHRTECLKILKDIENKICDGDWFFGDKLNKLDISILPFIRQYRIANPKWFDSQQGIFRVQKLLNNFLDSKLLKDVMYKYEEWETSDKPIYFPIIE